MFRERTLCLYRVRVMRESEIDRQVQRSDLSWREQEIMRLVARGFSNNAIAIELGLHRGTLKLHVDSLRRRLGVRSRGALAAYVGAQRPLPALDRLRAASQKKGDAPACSLVC